MAIEPISLGFHVLEIGCIGDYRGIDRPVWPLTLEEEAAAFGEGSHAYVFASRLAWLLQDNRSIQRSNEIAFEMRDLLRSVGRPCEVIFAVAYRDSENSGCVDGGVVLDTFPAATDAGVALEAGLEFLGHDVSSPTRSYHSIIRQPGFPERSEIAALVGTNGLIADLEVALELARRGSDVMSRPMWAIAIWAAE